MALPSSGQLSLSDIATELSVSLSNVSLRSMSNTAGFSSPDAVSEFYGYSSAPPPSPDTTKFWKYSGVNDRLVWRDSTPAISGYSETFSVSLWFRVDRSSKDNMLLFDIYPQGTTTSANRFFLNYSANLNRFVARYRSNSKNFDRQWALHGTNGTVTGVTNSSTGWVTSQRGNVNSDNFSHIVLTYDGTQSTATNAFKIYWNASELTAQAVANNGTRTNFDFTEITFGNDYNSGTGDASGYDEMRVYDKVLSSSEINDIYGQGNPRFSTSDGVTTDLILEDRAEATTPTDSAGQWTLHASSGTLTSL